MDGLQVSFLKFSFSTEDVCEYMGLQSIIESTHSTACAFWRKVMRMYLRELTMEEPQVLFNPITFESDRSEYILLQKRGGSMS